MTTPHQRDHGLHRVSRLTRWFAVGAAAATGLFAFLLARPAATATPATADPTTGGSADAAASRTGTPSTLPSRSSARSSTPSTLQSPSTVPQRTTRKPRASSGGS